ncbi:lysozyme C [Erpetoichthys calabaricus]|uniref:lysozyme n=1 Tax=Erpetoichthys calabaricus TaxID=27687 RepID=A0A8C4X4U1_ERPCA|nr:lysozyme C [Erpetoichthys calabaricus]
MKVFAFFILLIAVTSAKRLGRCTVASIFKANGLDGYEGYGLGNYICMAFWESHFKTHKVRTSDNVGKDYGIFQINSYKWCDDGLPGGKNLCKVKCGDLLGDDLKASVDCAKIIVKLEGLKSWYTWEKYCDGRNMRRWTKGCDLY